jgi:hypothetical protein
LNEQLNVLRELNRKFFINFCAKSGKTSRLAKQCRFLVDVINVKRDMKDKRRKVYIILCGTNACPFETHNNKDENEVQVCQ